jgi:hypothetical protein
MALNEVLEILYDVDIEICTIIDDYWGIVNTLTSKLQLMMGGMDNKLWQSQPIWHGIYRCT